MTTDKQQILSKIRFSIQIKVPSKQTKNQNQNNERFSLQTIEIQLTLGVKCPTVYGATIPMKAPSPFTTLLKGPTKRAVRSNELTRVPAVDKQWELTAIVKHKITSVWSHSAYEAAIKKTAAINDAKIKISLDFI